ncbi:hypothetical protein [Anaerophilus nitritogenes]|uniref:hypothetical protein n=1 Tax=Anaerophilus nitritogenes TaxID=2498136 RepID=UPI00101BBE57|nr:hypothetical protein [Anaerophilus nitritogenes]
MKIYILDQVLEYENDRNILDNMFKKINQMIENSKLILSCISIDGYDVYNDFQNYFIDHIKNIKEVKVIAKTENEICTDTLLLTMDYLKNAVPEIEILSNEFYKTPTNTTWNKLADLIEGINWIITSFISIDSHNELKNIINNYEEWNLYAKDIYSLKNIIIEFENILQNNDLVSTADILFYEIIPIFNEMKEKLEKLVYREVSPGAN